MATLSVLGLSRLLLDTASRQYSHQIYTAMSANIFQLSYVSYYADAQETCVKFKFKLTDSWKRFYQYAEGIYYIRW